MRRTCLSLAAFAAAAVLCATAQAQGAWPDRPLRLVVPFAAGSGADIVARAYGDKLAAALGQAVVVDNRVGAGGAIGAGLAAQAAPDGYTLFLGTQSTQASNVAMYKKLPYDPLKSFDAVSLLGTFPLILVVNPGVPAGNLRELVAWARANPGKLTFGYGTGSAQVNAELFKTLAQADVLLVPYKSNPLALLAVTTNEVNAMVIDPGPSLGLIAAGKVRALAVTTAKRSAVAPQLPTMAEAGMPGYELYGWSAALVPAGTPNAVTARLQTEIARIAVQPDIKQKLDQAGIEARSSTAAELQKFMEAELVKWSTHIRNAGMVPE